MIFVTGANGLLGSHICKSLIDEGHSVKALIREGSKTFLLDGYLDKLKVVNGDILNPESFADDLTNVKSIIHCAAVVSFHQTDKALMNKVNVEGTANMVNLALDKNIEYFLQISSVAALGRLTGFGTVTEDNKWQESKWNSNYATSKYYAELEVWRGIEEGLTAAMINPSVILAPGVGAKSSSQLFSYVWKESTFYPMGKVNYVDVRDVCKAALQCLKLKKTKERYIVNGGITTYKELFDLIAKGFGKKPPHIKSNSFLLKIGMFLDKLRSLITGKKTIITTETARLTKSEIYFDNTKAKNELNINFADLSDSIEWTCSKIKEQKSKLYN
ncbi:NAD-dependent epimerase/dehydratase family protein [Fulvivirga sp.]|uniref:NAD-dependent epimerase/dehydratase family protein n=1 Tax=Fulvivirga sp. TaxID=1931237 RepID=UPI0032ED1FFD